MSATYPASIVAFTTKTNKVDIVDASHINRLQEEVVAEQTELGKDVAGSTTNLKTRLAVSLADSGAMAQGTSDPASAVIGQPFYRTDTDQFKIYDGSTWDVMGPGALSIKSVTAISSGNSGDISIEASKLYKVMISLTNSSADDIVLLRVDSDSGANYTFFRHGLHTPGTNTAVNEGSSGATGIEIGDIDTASASSKHFFASFEISTFVTGTIDTHITGQVYSRRTDGNIEFVKIGGHHTGGTPTSFEILSSGGATLTGNIYLYEFTLST